MAAVTEIQTVNITINGIELQVPKGELVVEAVKRLGLEIPIFCYHPRMKPVGMCRMCLVETGQKMPDGTIRMFPKPAAGCTMPCTEGVVINTDSAMVHRDRKGVLEFLLINHPLDCPICDRGGECPLQNNTLFYGPSTSRYVEIKRHAPKAFPLSDYVTLDLERCIQCARCVRFTEEISGDSQLAFRFRGAATQPVTFQLTKFTSKFSGNVIEICPVGALTNRKYRFKARPWDLESRPGICTNCSNGCNVWMDYRAGKFVRMNGRTNEAVNEEWTCDKGKFGQEWYNSDDRLGVPLKRVGDKLQQTEWADVYSSVLQHFLGKGEGAALLAGHQLSNESLFSAKKFFSDHVGSSNVDHRFTADLSLQKTPSVSTIESFESAKSILVFGTSLADEEPILFLRVRKAWFQKGTKVVVAHEVESDVETFAEVVLRYLPGTGAFLAKALESLQSADISGDHSQSVADDAAKTTGVSAQEILAAAAVLKGAPIVTTTGLLDHENGRATYDSLVSLARATEGAFNACARGANERGAQLLGITPGTSGKNTHEILEAAANGTISSLWLLGVDPFSAHPDRDLVTRALENVEFLVVQESLQTEAFHYASVVLPLSAPAEQDGSFTNLEGRVQRMAAVLKPVGEAKPAWRAFTELTQRIKPGMPYFHPNDVMAAIAASVPEFKSVSYDALDVDGILV